MALFDVSGEAYDRFMGRFSEPLAALMIERLSLGDGQRVLDVGCGPGALTARLVQRLGSGAVAAVDPSPPFVRAARRRLPAVQVQEAPAEQLPFPAGCFDVVVAQLVVPFMTDPVLGLAEMGRVCVPDGSVAATVWDHGGGQGPLSPFWDAVRELDPGAHDESASAGAGPGELAALFVSAGLRHVESTILTVKVPFASFEEWWEPYTLGVGPAGVYVDGCDEEARAALERSCRRLLPEPPFELQAAAWCVTASP